MAPRCLQYKVQCLAAWLSTVMTARRVEAAAALACSSSLKAGTEGSLYSFPGAAETVINNWVA